MPIQVICANVITPTGYIAREDGREDFLPGVGWDDFVADVKECGNFIVGRETYEIVNRLYEGENYDDIQTPHKIIVTTNKNFKQPPGYTVVHSPAQALEYLSKQGIQKAYLAGGGKLNSAFAQQNFIDELRLTVAPYLLGSGRPQLYPGEFEANLRLKTCQQLSGGRVKLVYKVDR